MAAKDKKNMPVVRINITLERALVERLKQKKERTGIPISKQIARAVEKELR